uniref:CHK kinase-like domain-containing protein n=1 Tax=Graphocephala atropunctata TaxID=36148 RepID=A0A1B6L5F5_9HEMI
MDEPWKTNSFFARVLQSVENGQQEVEVIRFQVSSVVPAGSNYCSLLHRVRVDYNLARGGIAKSTSLIVKTPLASGEMKHFLEKTGVYRVECEVYNEILPRMFKIKDLNCTAKSYFCPIEKSLVLEDLKLSGFKMVDRLKQLDFPHCRLVLERLGQLHALSVAVHRKDPELLPGTGVHLMYNDKASEPDKKQLRNIIGAMITALVGEIEEVEGCSKYADAIRDGIDSHWDKALKFLRSNGDDFCVFNLGDLWTNNMMFKYNENGEVVDVKFIDFQNALFSTFAVDLNYFWWSSANEGVRENHREELFEVYRRSLNKTLDDIGCSEHLTKEGFDRQMKSSGPYVVYILSGVLPVAMAQPDDYVDHSDINPDEFVENPRRNNLQSKYFKAVIAKTLQQIDKFGLLD